MRIEQELKLDFKDVLIRPKRSTLTSRSEVDISREFVFPHSKRTYRGIPIVAANMDATGTFAMARALAKHQLSVALHKHYSEEELLDFFATQPESPPIFYSMGITAPDLDKFRWYVRETAPPRPFRRRPPQCQSHASIHARAACRRPRERRRRAPIARHAPFIGSTRRGSRLVVFLVERHPPARIERRLAG